jgi:hypothetical protein
MTNDEAHHQAVQEIVSRQRSFSAPFATPPTPATRPEPGPATDSVPYSPDMQPQFDQLRQPRRNLAALQPASTFVPSPAHADLEAAMVGQRDTPLALRMAEAARFGLSTDSEPPIEMRLSSLGVTQQEQPDHPQSFASPGIQDPPTEPQPRSTVALEGTITTSVNGRPEPTLYTEMRRRIAALEAAIAELPIAKPGIGHNNPPELIDPEPFWDDERRDVEVAIAVLNGQSPKPETLSRSAGHPLPPTSARRGRCRPT